MDLSPNSSEILFEKICLHLSGPILPIEERCFKIVSQEEKQKLYDPSHDLLHLIRVRNLSVALANEMRQQEQAPVSFDILIPAVWLHDYKAPEKNSPLRSQSSRVSAKEAVLKLTDWQYPTQFLSGIQHAIEAHSFSAQIKPETLEAKILQDADRLDALGAIGAMRTFSVGQRLLRPFYSLHDPDASQRNLDDKTFTLDHFDVKLFRLPEMMQTSAGMRAALARAKTLRFIKQSLINEAQGLLS